jgi:hypothetical protein
VRDRGRAFLDRLLREVLLPALLRAQLGELPPDGHEVARPSQRVAADVLEGVLRLAAVAVRHDGRAEKRFQRIRLQPARMDEIARALAADVVQEDLAQARRRVGDVDGAAAVLLRHRRRVLELGERFLADGDVDLQLVADPAELVGHLHQPHLREVPDVRRELAGVARARGRLARDVLVEVLVDAVDEDRDRRRDPTQARDQLVVGFVRRAEEVAAIEVEQVDEVIDDAREVRILEERVELRIDARPSVMSRRFSVATAIAISQTRFQLSVDSP